MTNKNHTLIVDKEENIDRLIAAIVEIMPQIDIKIIPKGGARGGLLRPDKADSECEFRDRQNRKIGTFNFERTNGVYVSKLNLSRMPDNKYDIIMKVISTEFSRFLKKPYT